MSEISAIGIINGIKVKWITINLEKTLIPDFKAAKSDQLKDLIRKLHSYPDI